VTVSPDTPLTAAEKKYLLDRKTLPKFSLNVADATELGLKPGLQVTLPEWFRCQERVAWERGGRVGAFTPKAYPAFGNASAGK
jgi:hypothetical protein